MAQGVLRPEHLRRGEQQPDGNRLLAAIAYLTTVPVPESWVPGGETGKAAAFFPLVGTAVAATGILVYTLAVPYAGALFAALAAAVVWTLGSGILKEDGRWVFGRGRDLLIQLAALLLRWQLLFSMVQASNGVTGALALALITAHAVPRAGVVAMAWSGRPQGYGTGFELSESLRSVPAVFAILQVLLLAFAVGGVQLTLFVGVMGYLLIRVLSTIFYSTAGGVNGNALGLIELLLEISMLALVATSLVA